MADNKEKLMETIRQEGVVEGHSYQEELQKTIQVRSKVEDPLGLIVTNRGVRVNNASKYTLSCVEYIYIQLSFDNNT